MLRLPRGDTEFLKFAESGAYQRNALFLALAFVSKWRVAVDVGAHVGFVSCDIAPHFAKVHAFEPNPENYECLRQNTPMNVACINRALGAEYGWGRLVNPKADNSGAWELVESDKQDVTVSKLDAYGLTELDFIKIDAQGSEMAILKGATATLTKHKPVALIETFMNGKFDNRIKAYMAELGYETAIHLGKNTVFVWKQLPSATLSYLTTT